MVYINFSRPKKSVANEANLFCVAGQDIFVSALFDGPMTMSSRDRSPVVVLDHDLHEYIDASPIIETFSLSIIPTRYKIEPRSQTNRNGSA